MLKIKTILSSPDLINVIFIFFAALILVGELFLIKAQPQTYDGWTHIITINKFAQNLKEGNFPVTFIDNVANYGFPLGQIAQQTTSYVGAVFVIIFKNTLLAYNLTIFVGALISALGLYYLLRQHVSASAALAGTLLFNFAPYRINNIYIRSALPEFFASTFIILILIGINRLFCKKDFKSLLIIAFGTTLLAITHPMMLVVGSIIIVAYGLFYLTKSSLLLGEKIIHLLLILASAIIGLIIAGYYLIPLFLEMKYFYYGQVIQTGRTFPFLSLNNYWQEFWLYSTPQSGGVRDPRLQSGIIESLILIVAAFMIGLKKTYNHKKLISWLLIASGITIFLTLPDSNFIYTHIGVLANIQLPWRMLTSLQFIPAIIFALFINKSKFSNTWLIAIAVLIAVMRFPNLYGKNYIQYPEKRYEFSIVNLHSTNMNTVWTGQTEDYPLVSEKVAIISGDGQISNLSSKSTQRTFDVNATNELQVVDYTFYFPGWELLIDNKPEIIEFQNHLYRGIITYKIPPGQHKVELLYKDTKIRLLGKAVSGGGLLMLTILYLI